MSTAGGADVVVRGLSFAYRTGDFRLDVDECRIAPGEAVAIVGTSGSGKTTLLDLVAGILVPDRGEVAVDGFRWSEHSDAARRARRIAEVGLVFQEFELLDHLTVRENVLLPYFVNPALRLDDAARARADELARATAIERYLARRPRELSQGERQRVALCRGLVTAPALLLADEPTGNLDHETSQRVMDLLVDEARGRGATLVVVTHDRARLGVFDRVLDLDELRSPAALSTPGGQP